MSKLDEILGNLLDTTTIDTKDAIGLSKQQIKDLLRELFVESEGVEHAFNKLVEEL